MPDSEKVASGSAAWTCHPARYRRNAPSGTIVSAIHRRIECEVSPRQPGADRSLPRQDTRLAFTTLTPPDDLRAFMGTSVIHEEFLMAALGADQTGVVSLVAMVRLGKPTRRRRMW